MKKIIKILMERDGMEYDEAKELLNEVIHSMRDALKQNDIFEAEEIFTSELGLEPDYLEDIIYEL